jgi:hypothetical protein
MLYSPTFIPLLHGEVGLLDELLLFGAPLIVIVIIFTIARRRARKKAKPRERAPQNSPTGPSESNTPPKI